MAFLSQIFEQPSDRVAIADSDGEHTFGTLIDQAQKLAVTLQGIKQSSLSEPDSTHRIAFLAGKQATSASMMLSIWLADSVAVPVDPLLSLPEWLWRLNELGVNTLLHSPAHRSEAQHIAQSCQIK